jgi:Na+-driven multidrug efflux pump
VVDFIFLSAKISFSKTKTAKGGIKMTLAKTQKPKKTVDFTEGAIWGKMIKFVLPIMLTNILNMLYNAADIVVVSMSSEANAVGATSTSGPFLTLIINLFIGFSVGSNVLVARYLGAKNEKNRATRAALLISCFIISLYVTQTLFLGQRS